jgi:glycosyltransferase involved in cell wall biosynthesis
VQLSRNFGKEAALTAGLAAARGEVVVLMDADGQHPTALLADMLRHWQAGADVVYAVRSTRADQSALHRRMVAAFYGIVNWRSRVRIRATRATSGCWTGAWWTRCWPCPSATAS